MKNINDLLKKLNINANNINIYKTAVTHSSYANENSTASNERLEFLGDAILDQMMSEYLYNNLPNENEGVLTKIRAQRVCEDALYAYSEHINLKDYILLGKGESQRGPTISLIADCFEAVIGAIYLDLGFKKCQEFFHNFVINHISDTLDLIDYKTILQEKYANKKNIKYHLTKTLGPSHMRMFYTDCLIGGILCGSGVGKSKKESEQQAAKLAYFHKEIK